MVRKRHDPYKLRQLRQIVQIVFLAIIGFYTIILWWWQINVFKGKAMKNPDGSIDDWREPKISYGMATADTFLARPVAIAGIVLVFSNPRWGYYILALWSFWFIWANIMTTATSLRFEKPKINLN